MGMELKRLNEYSWEIPKQGDMNVSTIIYTSNSLLDIIRRDRTLLQARNVACLKGIQRHAYVMPDGHQGYGFPIGGVAAFDMERGVISPGGVGYDINCGVRLLKTEFTEEDIRNKRESLLNQISREVPAGVGKGGILRINRNTLEKVCGSGAGWAINNGYGFPDDLLKTEESGCLPGADFSCLSPRAVERGIPQLGTLGAGNHFLEIQKVVQIFEEETARTFGIHSENQILVMIHCGSRGLGHQIASDYIREMENRQDPSGLPDRELINAPIQSDLGKRYYKAMACAVNFAFVNRQMITHWVRNVFRDVMGTSEGMHQVYDVCHNVAKFEKHEVRGEERMFCIHRKGATRSFGPGRSEVPECYREVGQPVIIPGSMGTSSYILVGTKEAEALSFGSTAHGAGRMMSRHEAQRRFRGERVKYEMESRGIALKFTGWKGVAEEASGAYKDVDEVVQVSHRAGIGRIVAKVVPVGVMKG
ncbi:RtcB family protein [Acidobacteriota bacterium]